MIFQDGLGTGSAVSGGPSPAMDCYGLSHWDDVILWVVLCTEDYSVMVSSSLSCARAPAMLPPDKNMMWVGPLWGPDVKTASLLVRLVIGLQHVDPATPKWWMWFGVSLLITCYLVILKPLTLVILVILALSADSQGDLPSRYLPTFWRKVSRTTSPTIRRLPPISTLEGEGTGQCFLLQEGW